jgi:hypothetical protein
LKISCRSTARKKLRGKQWANKIAMTAEIELARQSFAKLAFGVEYNEGGSLDLLQIARCAAAAAKRPIK